jgi:hypothetical protein
MTGVLGLLSHKTDDLTAGKANGTTASLMNAILRLCRKRRTPETETFRISAASVTVRSSDSTGLSAVDWSTDRRFCQRIVLIYTIIALLLLCVSARADFVPTTIVSESVTQGSSITSSVTSTTMIAPAVAYLISGLPAGATATFSPVSCNPTCTMALTITTTSSTPIGTYPITLTGTNGTNTHTTTFNLTVTSEVVAPICGMILGGPVIFCDTFDTTENTGIPGRTGALDPNVWGVSRLTGNTGFGQGSYNGWAGSTTVQTCTGPATVVPPNDVIICNGQLREATNDNASGIFDDGTVTTLAMYPKQPFDFVGRTGTVSFDVSNDTEGSHSAWPEFWMSNLPIPVPFSHFETWQSLPQFGFGIRFDGFVNSNGAPASCPEGAGYIGVGSAILVNNYVGNDFDNVGNTVNLIGYDCVLKSTGPGQMNHYEVQVSQNQIDVYGTDAGVVPSPTTLRHLATIFNANLGFTRGLVWIEDVHYNADKGGTPSQRQHTFSWDNVAFDGIFTYRDFSYDALDVVQPDPATMTVDLGKFSLANQTASWNIPNVPANSLAAAVRVLFNFYHQSVPTVLNVIVNGHAHPTPWPYPDTIGSTWRTFAVTIPITDLVPGTNVVQLGSDQPIITGNVDIVLAAVPGGVPVLPGSNNMYPGSFTPVPTVTLTASPTSIIPGQSSVLTWSSTNAASCLGSGGWSGTLATNGIRSVTPSVNTTYTLVCIGTGGSGTASVSVMVTSPTMPPTVTLTASPTSIIPGQSATLTWSSTNAASCSASGSWSGVENLSGALTVSPTANSTYILTCSGSGGSASSSASITVTPPSASCQFLSVTAIPAFCENLAKGASPGGRAGDLDDSRWSVSRFLNGGISATNLIAFPPTPVEPCKSGVTSTTPDNDIMVCDGASGHLGQFETAMIAQNYAMISMRPRQAFDFAGRVGTITFNVDAVTQGEGSWWPAVYVTDQPFSAAINSASVMGLLPTNGVGLNFDDNCGVKDASLTSVNIVYVYVNNIETLVNMNNPICFMTKRGQLNHIEIELSITGIQVWASDYSPDNVTFPNFRLVGSATISLPFTRGYVHFEQKVRAPVKNEPGFYTPGYANNYWSGLGFDGPVVNAEVGYEVPDALTVDPNSANDTDAHIAGALNIGYGILNTPTSIYSCCTSSGGRTTIRSFSVPNVNLSGVTSASLTFGVTYTYIAPSFTTNNVALQYSINGGPLLNPNPQPNYAAQNLCTGCPGNPVGGGGVLYSFPINLSSLVNGTNTITFSVSNSVNSYPPVISNIEVITFGNNPTQVANPSATVVNRR